MYRNPAAWAALLVICVLAAACVPVPAAAPTQPAPPVVATTQPAAPLPATQPAAASFADAWDYCAAVENIDAPDARYTGPAMPDALAAGLQFAITGEAGTPTPPIIGNSFWRCMDAQVYACTIGANLPCTEKANTSTNPTEGMLGFCKEQPTAEFIPMYATGHDTIYEWVCKDGKPEAGKQIAEVDARGFIKGIWYEIPRAP